MPNKTTQLSRNVFAIQEDIVQAYLICGSERAVLFDCCVSGGQNFADAVHSITDKPIQLVFSHTDPDHTAAQGFFDAPYMHPAEFAYYDSRGNAGHPRLALWEGQTIDLGDTTLEVILLPGHTPGSIALLDHANRRLFCGDSLSDKWIFMFGPGRNVEALIASMIKLESLSKGFDTIHPAHGSLQLGCEWISRTRQACEKLLAGELAPSEPPIHIPAKNFIYQEVNLFYIQEL